MADRKSSATSALQKLEDLGMKRLIHTLVILAAAAFVLGIVMKLGGVAPLFGKVPPITIWRFTIGCLAFAMALTLIQIRNASG